MEAPMGPTPDEKGARKNYTFMTRAELTTPRSAAVAGIIFSILLMISLVLIWISVPDDLRDPDKWLSQSGKTVDLALYLLPFAGVAFLWFIGVLRDRIGQYEDRFFSTVFFGSGILFLAMLFTSAAVGGGTLMVYRTMPEKLIGSGIYIFGRTVSHQIMHVYTMKMAAVFMFTTCTVSIRTGIIPRWMALFGYGLATVLVLSMGYRAWVPLVFPLWVLLISVYILIANLKSPVPGHPMEQREMGDGRRP
jgi:hypothetical protein